MKKPRYISLDDSEQIDLDASLAYVQAASALDVAAQQAVECKDTESLTNVAALWIRLGENLGHNDAPVEEEKPERSPAGFALTANAERGKKEIESDKD